MKKYLAEFIGTCVLVFIACGTAAAIGCDAINGCGYLATAFAFGLVLMGMAYSIGNVSGCHVNPAVSIGMLVAGRMSVKDFIGYVIAQYLGGIAGAALIGCVLGFGTDDGFGANGLYNGNVGVSLLIEILLTFVFVFVILGVTSKPEFSPVAGLVIGLTLTVVHIIGIHFTGTSVNPARSFGPALFATICGSHPEALAVYWVFLVAPLIGGALAAIVWKAISAEKAVASQDAKK